MGIFIFLYLTYTLSGQLFLSFPQANYSLYSNVIVQFTLYLYAVNFAVPLYVGPNLSHLSLINSSNVYTGLIILNESLCWL